MRAISSGLSYTRKTTGQVKLELEDTTSVRAWSFMINNDYLGEFYMEKKNIVLRIEHLNKSFKNSQVLKDLNLDIKESEFVTLLGPSGSGKTTLLNIIAGFVTADSGDIYIGEKRVNKVEPRKRGLGMVFQSWALFPHMNVFDNIAFGLKIKKYPKDKVKKRVNEALELVKLSGEGVSQKFPSQLSGGMQQRVAVARAIVPEPNIMLFDEPLSNLDAKLRKEMRIELKKLHKKLQMTVLYVTHDQEEALSMSDQICVMHRGSILRKAIPNEVYNNPRFKFVCNFLGEANLFEGRIKEVLGQKVIVEAEGINLVASLDFPAVVNQQILLALRPEKIHINNESSLKIDNSLRATVKDIAYYGKSVNYYLDLAGKDITVFKYQETSDCYFEKGKEVYIEFPATAFCILKNEREEVDNE